MLADEMTGDLRLIRLQALTQARARGQSVTLPLVTKGVSFGYITGNPGGSVDTSQVEGVNPDLRIRPFFAQGGTISIREFLVGAFHAEMGLEAVDPELAIASSGGRVVTPSGMVLDGTMDPVTHTPHDMIEAPPPAPDPVNGNEVDVALVDYMEFYLLNYFKPGLGQQDASTQHGLQVFNQIGCATCHVQNLTINHDRRVADVNTVYDPVKGIFNRLFATATTLIHTVDDGRMVPNGQPFVVQNIFTDFKRHDLGPNFHERNWDGSFQTQFLTRPLWGVGSFGALGHDGRSNNLVEVILRHGGEAQASRDAFANLFSQDQQNGDQGDARDLLNFLSILVLFPPDDTASNLDPGNPAAANLPQIGHGSIKLTVLFNNPRDPE